MTMKLNLAGQRFGMLLVIKEYGSINKRVAWVCKCDCGNEKIVLGCELKRGQYKSCGCNQTPIKVKNRDHPLYEVWRGMKARCRDEKHASFKNYGGRGIKVCPEWDTYYEAFYNWAIANGYKPGLHIDRRENDLGYSPENCQWLVQKENGRKTRQCKLDYTKVGEIIKSTSTIKTLAKQYNVSEYTIYRVKSQKSWA